MADRGAVFAQKAAAGRGLGRGQWAQITGQFHNVQRFEIEFREYLNGLDESLQTQWGDPEAGDPSPRFTLYYRIGKKRGPKREA